MTADAERPELSIGELYDLPRSMTDTSWETLCGVVGFEDSDTRLAIKGDDSSGIITWPREQGEHTWKGETYLVIDPRTAMALIRRGLLDHGPGWSYVATPKGRALVEAQGFS